MRCRELTQTPDKFQEPAIGPEGSVAGLVFLSRRSEPPAVARVDEFEID